MASSSNNFPDDDKLVLEHIIRDIVVRANQELKNVRQQVIDAAHQTPATQMVTAAEDQKVRWFNWDLPFCFEIIFFIVFLFLLPLQTPFLNGESTIDDHTGHTPSTTTAPPPTSHKSSSTSQKEFGAILTPYLVTETLAAFVLRSVAMDPRNSFDMNYEFTSKEVERLVQVRERKSGGSVKEGG